MSAKEAGDLYEWILRIAALPVLALILWFCWIVTNYLMNPNWQQGRRNKQIRKAVAARRKRLEEARSVEDTTESKAG